MGQHVTDGNLSSRERVNQLLSQGVTSTVLLCEKTGLARRTVQVLKKRWHEEQSFMPYGKLNRDGTRVVYESPYVTHFLGPIGENYH